VPRLTAALYLAVALAAGPEDPPVESPGFAPAFPAPTVGIPFVENHGQFSDSSVLFHARTFGGGVFAMRDGSIVYSLPKSEGTKLAGGTVLRERLLGAKPIIPEGSVRTKAVVSFFVGRDSEQWKSGLPAWDTVSLGEPYEGVQVHLRAQAASVEKIFIVSPGADARRIRLAVEGADALSVEEDGSLCVRTRLGEVRFTAPVAYQEIDGGRRDVAVAYNVRGDQYGFEVGTYDPARALVIDPLLASTFLGGSTAELANDVRVDSSGHVLVVGWTTSSDFPTRPGCYDQAWDGSFDAFVSKLDHSLSNLLASTFLGGSGEDNAQAATIDGDGNIYVAGFTRSANFPVTPGAYDSAYAAEPDVFIAKLDSQLTNLLASTYLGGNADDTPRGVAVDGQSNLVAVGWSFSTNFPTTAGAYGRTHAGFADVFVSRLDPHLTNLLASTLLGGEGSDWGLMLAVDPAGPVLVSGSSYSPDFPTTAGAYATNYIGAGDMLISMLDADLTNLLASTYLGGFGNEQALALALDPAGRVVVAGFSESPDFPTTSEAFNPFYNGSRDATVSILDHGLTSLQASTYLGGSGADWFAHSVEFDGQGTLYLAGYSDSRNFEVTLQAYAPTNSGNVDVIVSKFDPHLTNLLASTCLGGSALDYATSLALDPAGNVVIAGYTTSTNYPSTAGAYDTSLSAPGSAFVSKLDPSLSRPVSSLAADFYGNPRRGSSPLSVGLKALVAGSNPSITWYGWDFDNDGNWDQQGSGLGVVTGVYASPGFYSVRMAVSNSTGEAATRTRLHYVRVHPLTYHVSLTGSNLLPYADWSIAATSVASAVNLATHGDTVRVADGVHRGALQVNLIKAVRLESVNGSASTVMDAGGSSRCVYLSNTGAVVHGFTITGGRADADDGGGAYIGGNGTIEDCVIVSNRAQWGGGIYCSGGGLVQRCVVHSNTVTGLNSAGGGVALDSGGILRNCLVTGNSAEYGAGGVGCWEPGGLVQNCTIHGNRAASGGGLVLYEGGAVENGIVVGNAALDGNSNFWFTVTNASYTCTAPPVGGPGNFSADPLFVNPMAGNYRLAAGSPCIDAAINLAAVADDLDHVARPLDGNTNGVAAPDMGAYEFAHPLADTDGDWLRDTNELALGTNPTDPDTDDDRMGDGSETLAGCDPLDWESYLGLEGVSRSGAGFVIQWQSVTGKHYRIDRSTNLAIETFGVPLKTNIAAIASMNTETDVTATSVGPYFYRIGVEK